MARLVTWACLIAFVGCSSAGPLSTRPPQRASSVVAPSSVGQTSPDVGGPWTLAFATERPGGEGLDVFVATIPSGDVRFVAGVPTRNDYSPSISPDGRRIAFRRNPARGDEGDIWLVPVTGNAPVNLTHSPGVADWSPMWSPSGSHIAYFSNDGGGMDVWVMRPDGTGKTRVTRDPGLEEYPTWSPDESRLAFNSNSGAGFDISVIELDGGRPVNLTDHPARDQWPAWSPDGEWIAFMSDRDGSEDVFVMRPDGSDLRNVTGTPDVHESLPAWLPNGLLTFSRHGEGGPISIWAVAPSGGPERRIRTPAQPVFAYTWGPGRRPR